MFFNVGVPMIWPFILQRLPVTVQNALDGLHAQPWRDVSCPSYYARGLPDSKQPGVFYFPSPYSVPTGVRVLHTQNAWCIQWRYLERHEPTRRKRLAPDTWAWVGRNSQRLVTLAGAGPWNPENVEGAVKVWLEGQSREACSHADVMSRLAHSATRAAAQG